MDKKLLFQTITKLLIGMLLIVLLIFIPANTINFWNGWLLMGLLFIPITIVGIIMLFKAPDLLRKRLKTKETEKEQKAVVLYSGIMFLSMSLILGSIISFIIFLIYPIIIAKRIKNEEQVLEKDLQGYSEYKKKVKYRLIPFVW